jgi:hypothetical protein
MQKIMRRAAWVGLLVHVACTPADPSPADARAQSAQGSDQQIDWGAVDAAMGRSGSMQDGGVYRFGMPRSGLSVTSQGVAIRPSPALGSWLALKQSGPNEAVAMGDLVLATG